MKSKTDSPNKVKNIVYILYDPLESLPPCMSQLSALCEEGCHIVLVTMYTSEYIRDFFSKKNVVFCTQYSHGIKKVGRISEAKRILSFRKFVKTALKSFEYDLLWVGSGSTARYCRDVLNYRKPVVLNIYELYDKMPHILRAIKTVAQKAQSVIVPEYNRAHIFKVWFKLRKTPIVLPNKPRFPKVEILPETKKIVEELEALNKKIVLYQGWISKDRDLTTIAQAMSTLENKDEFALVLMGKETVENTVDYLQSQFSNTIHIPFVQPPQHLFITEIAHMGIATYDDSSLNNIFCAPNKIYEYAEKKVPILARDIPGLINTVGKFDAGVCVDMDDICAIAHGILRISERHDEYIEPLNNMLEECNVEETLARVIRI